MMILRHHDDTLKTWHLLASQGPRLTVLQTRQHLRQHPVVVLGLEAVRGHKAPEPDLVEAVLQLRGLIGGVDVDQDQPRLGRGKLCQVPLMGVGSPDTNPVTRVRTNSLNYSFF